MSHRASSYLPTVRKRESSVCDSSSTPSAAYRAPARARTDLSASSSAVEVELLEQGTASPTTSRVARSIGTHCSGGPRPTQPKPPEPTAVSGRWQISALSACAPEARRPHAAASASAHASAASDTRAAVVADANPLSASSRSLAGSHPATEDSRSVRAFRRPRDAALARHPLLRRTMEMRCGHRVSTFGRYAGGRRGDRAGSSCAGLVWRGAGGRACACEVAGGGRSGVGCGAA